MTTSVTVNILIHAALCAILAAFIATVGHIAYDMSRDRILCFEDQVKVTSFDGMTHCENRDDR